MPRSRMQAIAVLLTAAAVAAPALASTIHSHPAKRGATTKTGPHGPRGARGPRGVRGLAGPTGPAGEPGTPGGGGGAEFIRTVVVSPSGSTAVADGALLLAAVAAIGDPAPGTADLVWIEPGTYDLGATALEIPSHVEVQ